MISKVDGLPDAVVTDPGAETQPAALLYVNGYALILESMTVCSAASPVPESTNISAR